MQPLATRCYLNKVEEHTNFCPSVSSATARGAGSQACKRLP